MPCLFNVTAKLFDQLGSQSTWQRCCVLDDQRICLADLSIGVYQLTGRLIVLKPFESGDSQAASPAEFHVENDRYGVYECRMSGFDAGRFVLLTFMFGAENVWEFRVFDVDRNSVVNAGSFTAEPHVRLLPYSHVQIYQQPSDNGYMFVFLAGNRHQLVRRHLLTGQVETEQLADDFASSHHGTEVLFFTNSQFISINRRLTAAKVIGTGKEQRINGAPDSGDWQLFRVDCGQLHMLVVKRPCHNWSQLHLWRLDTTGDDWRWDKLVSTTIGSSRRVLDFSFDSKILTALLSSDFERNSRLTVSCWWLTVPSLSDLCRLVLHTKQNH